MRKTKSQVRLFLKLGSMHFSAHKIPFVDRGENKKTKKTIEKYSQGFRVNILHRTKKKKKKDEEKKCQNLRELNKLLFFTSWTPISFSGHTHFGLSYAQLAASTSGTWGGGGSSLSCRRRRCVGPLWTRRLCGHSPPEETHAHLQQLAVDHRRDGVLLGQALKEAERIVEKQQVDIGRSEEGRGVKRKIKKLKRSRSATLSFFSSCRRMAKSRRAHRALQQGPRLLSKPALSTRLFRAAMFRAPKSCSNSLSASDSTMGQSRFSTC